MKFCSLSFFFSIPFSLQFFTSEYLFVMHDPRASMTGIDVKFSEAMSSMPVLFFGREVRMEGREGGKDEG